MNRINKVGKRRLLQAVSLLVMTVLLFLFCGCGAGSQEAPVRIAIATDLHYLSPALTDEKEVFETMLSQGDGKVVQYISEITDAFCAEMLDKKPDYLILSGDLTFNGATQSHRDLLGKLETLQKAGICVLVIPGNHDVDSLYAASFFGDTAQRAKALSSQDFVTLYETFGPAQAISRDETTFSYHIRAGKRLSIIALDANCFGQGFLKDSTLQWLEKELRWAKRRNISVITLSHQNLYAHNPMLSFGYQLYNADKLQALLDKYDVKCHFSGHIHTQSIREDDITEIVPSSLAVSPVQYGWVEATSEKLVYISVQTDVAGWAKSQGSTDENLLNFAVYADEFFRQNGHSKVLEAYQDADLTEAEKQLLAETFGYINAAYFAGRQPELAALQEGIALWEQQTDAFMLRYIHTMLEQKSDPTAITISLR